jgi:cytochrome c biogenesis protein CcmG/thiol:disulfide interchange protein DsbE
MSRASLFIPLGVFLLIVGVGYAGFKLNDPHELPSALLNKPFPEFSAPLLGNGLSDGLADGETLVDRTALLGEPVLVNVWATWCPTCKAEHEQLLRIRESTGLRMVGVNYKDDPAKARNWLRQLGDPYEFVVQDTDGSLGVELGVYGAPESFLLDARGTIVYKRVGDINPRIWRDELAPVVARLNASSTGGDDE